MLYIVYYELFSHIIPVHMYITLLNYLIQYFNLIEEYKISFNSFTSNCSFVRQDRVMSLYSVSMYICVDALLS